MPLSSHDLPNSSSSSSKCNMGDMSPWTLVYAMWLQMEETNETSYISAWQTGSSGCCRCAQINRSLGGRRNAVRPLQPVQRILRISCGNLSTSSPNYVLGQAKARCDCNPHDPYDLTKNLLYAILYFCLPETFVIIPSLIVLIFNYDPSYKPINRS